MSRKNFTPENARAAETDYRMEDFTEVEPDRRDQPLNRAQRRAYNRLYRPARADFATREDYEQACKERRKVRTDLVGFGKWRKR